MKGYRSRNSISVNFIASKTTGRPADLPRRHQADLARQTGWSRSTSWHEMDRPRSLLSPDTGSSKAYGPRAELRPRLGPGSLRQAALTVLRNLPTSSLRRLLSLDSDCAAERTCDEADPVSLAPRCTSVMWEETCWVPCAACCTLREISCVAAPCSSTAAAMVDEISDSFSMVPLISLIAFTDSWVAAWIPSASRAAASSAAFLAIKASLNT